MHTEDNDTSFIRRGTVYLRSDMRTSTFFIWSGIIFQFHPSFRHCQSTFFIIKNKAQLCRGGLQDTDVLMLWCSPLRWNSLARHKEIHDSYTSVIDVRHWKKLPSVMYHNQPWSDRQKWHTDVGRCPGCSRQNIVPVCQLAVPNDNFHPLSCTWACGNNLLWSSRTRSRLIDHSRWALWFSRTQMFFVW